MIKQIQNENQAYKRKWASISNFLCERGQRMASNGRICFFFAQYDIPILKKKKELKIGWFIMCFMR